MDESKSDSAVLSAQLLSHLTILSVFHLHLFRFLLLFPHLQLLPTLLLHQASQYLYPQLLPVHVTGSGESAKVAAVEVTPKTADVVKGKSEQFKAVVKGEGNVTPDQGVTWTVSASDGVATPVTSDGLEGSVTVTSAVPDLLLFAVDVAVTISLVAVSSCATVRFPSTILVPSLRLN